MNTKKYNSVFIKALSLLIIVAFFLGCKNDLQVNADYDAQAIVYGVINPYDSVQVFRITKSFSGEGNPQAYAKNPDSNYFRDVDLVLVESLFGEERRRMNLIRIEVSNKELGEFFGPDQILYHVYPTKNNPDDAMYFNSESDFRLEGTVDGKEIGGNFSIVKESLNAPFFLSSANGFRSRANRAVSLINGVNVSDLEFDLKYPTGTKVGSLKMIFTYYEVYLGATEEVEKTIEFELGEKVFNDSQNPKPTDVKFSGRGFYERIAAVIPDASETPNLLYRKSGPIDFKMIAVSEDLFYYRQVKNSGEGIAQDRPEYTNVVNGFGVLAGRQVITMNEQLIAHGFLPVEFLLSSASDDELATGVLLGLTGAKAFCSDPSHKFPSACQ